MKSTMLSKMMWLIILTLILSAAFTALIFNYTGITVFARLKVQEIEPRTKYVAELTREYMEKEISQAAYARAIGLEYRIWDALLYVYDADGYLFVHPREDAHGARHVQATKELLGRIIEENKSYYIYETFMGTDLVLGEPVRSAGGEAIGAVFMVKPLTEVSAAMQNLTYALIISLLVVTMVMLLPAYFGSRGLTRPINKMIRAADAMACGDFSARADGEGEGEIAQLGRALNYLSKALSETIGDLTFERNRLRATLYGLGEGIIGFDEKGEVSQFNPASVSLLGGEGEEEPTELEAFAELMPAVRRVLAEGGAQSLEIVCGSATLRCSATALVEEGTGRIEGAVALIRDISESARLEQTRRDYVANVSHELRTPMASIRSLADALNDGLIKNEADRQRYYGYILRESIRLSRLIDDLLELSRLQSGSVALSRQKFSVEEMVQDVAERYLPGVEEKGQNLRLSLPENCPAAFSNPDRAEQVLIALLDNAIKHAGEGSDIEMRVEDRGEKLLLTVSNPGGISKEDAAHVFERFYKVDRSHSGGGTGLGLAIARELMTLMREEICVKSENGTVSFAFTLQKAGAQAVEKA